MKHDNGAHFNMVILFQEYLKYVCLKYEEVNERFAKNRVNEQEYICHIYCIIVPVCNKNIQFGNMNFRQIMLENTNNG